MNGASLTTRGSSRRAWLALLAYALLLAALLAFAVAMISNLLTSLAALEQSRETLAHFDRKLQRSAPLATSATVAGEGSPFLGGKTVTIAGAALQERVEAAVKKAGGNILSSQIDLDGPHAAEGFVSLTESLEIDQASLQPLLYDLEAGMPYLFVENLAIQLPQVLGEAESAPMRVVVTVSGQCRESQ